VVGVGSLPHQSLNLIEHAPEQQHPELGPGAVHRPVRETQRRYFDPPSYVTNSAPRWLR
jgi:hypothetical protein